MISGGYIVEGELELKEIKKYIRTVLKVLVSHVLPIMIALGIIYELIWKAWIWMVIKDSRLQIYQGTTL